MSMRIVVAVWLLRFTALAGIAGWAVTASAVRSDAVQRCGWFDNPTPSNAWLHDGAGEWAIGIQGGHQAKGDWPRFGSARWVPTGVGLAGYGCACMTVIADAQSREVARIVSSRVQPLSVCRKDPALKHKEPWNPLKERR